MPVTGLCGSSYTFTYTHKKFFPFQVIAVTYNETGKKFAGKLLYNSVTVNY